MKTSSNHTKPLSAVDTAKGDKTMTLADRIIAAVRTKKPTGELTELFSELKKEISEFNATNAKDLWYSEWDHFYFFFGEDAQLGDQLWTELKRWDDEFVLDFQEEFQQIAVQSRTSPRRR